MQTALEQTKSCLIARALYGSGRALFSEDISFSPVTLQDVLTKARVQEFHEYVELNQPGALKQWISELYNTTFIPHQPCNPSLIIDLAIAIAQLYYQTLLDLYDKQVVEHFDLKHYTAAISATDTLSGIVSCLQNMIDEQQADENNQSSIFVRAAKEYIKEHFSETIHLNDVAASCNINSVYLSRIFKEETGSTFSDYLIQYRIQISKELLKDIRMNITEVAERVGYCDSKHFSKSFKAAVGLTPKDYRKLYAR